MFINCRIIMPGEDEQVVHEIDDDDDEDDNDGGSPADSDQSKTNHGGVLAVVLGICHWRIHTIEYNDDDDDDDDDDDMVIMKRSRMRMRRG